MTEILILVAVLCLLGIGVPVAFALGGLGLILLVVGGFSPLMVAQGLLGAIDSFVLLAIPLFLLMSNVMLKGGVGHDLFNAAGSWVGHWPGGLAVATILSCALFASISGSSVATAATIATVAIPELTRHGYRRRFVLGLLAAGGTLGILIPPSIPMIVYGVITEQSILHLFLAGIGPGLLLAGLFIVFAVLHARFAGSFEPRPRATWAERRRYSLRALPTVAIALIVILGLYAGAFTPTEASAVGLALALVSTGALFRSLDWAALKAAVMDSLETTVTIFLIIAGAKIFAMAITLYRMPQDISVFLTANLTEPMLFVAGVCLVLLVLGLVLESLSMLLVMMPVLYPSVLGLGLDPIWFGIFFVIMIECALITPPLGLNLFVIQSVSRDRLGEVAAGVWPFMLLMLVAVLFVTVFPAIALYIPFRL